MPTNAAQNNHIMVVPTVIPSIRAKFHILSKTLPIMATKFVTTSTISYKKSLVRDNIIQTRTRARAAPKKTATAGKAARKSFTFSATPERVANASLPVCIVFWKNSTILSKKFPIFVKILSFVNHHDDEGDEDEC